MVTYYAGLVVELVGWAFLIAWAIDKIRINLRIRRRLNR